MVLDGLPNGRRGLGMRGDLILEHAGHHYRTLLGFIRLRTLEEVVQGAVEELQPAAEMIPVDLQRNMGHEGDPMVAAPAQQNSLPESVQPVQVLWPAVLYGVVEDRTDQFVLPGAAVESVHQEANVGNGDDLLLLNGGAFTACSFIHVLRSGGLARPLSGLHPQGMRLPTPSH